MNCDNVTIHVLNYHAEIESSSFDYYIHEVVDTKNNGTVLQSLFTYSLHFNQNKLYVFIWGIMIRVSREITKAWNWSHFLQKQTRKYSKIFRFLK